MDLVIVIEEVLGFMHQDTSAPTVTDVMMMQDDFTDPVITTILDIAIIDINIGNKCQKLSSIPLMSFWNAHRIS